MLMMAAVLEEVLERELEYKEVVEEEEGEAWLRAQVLSLAWEPNNDGARRLQLRIRTLSSRAT